jgi:hypothetical protein
MRGRDQAKSPEAGGDRRPEHSPESGECSPSTLKDIGVKTQRLAEARLIRDSLGETGVRLSVSHRAGVCGDAMGRVACPLSGVPVGAGGRLPSTLPTVDDWQSMTVWLVEDERHRATIERAPEIRRLPVR